MCYPEEQVVNRDLTLVAHKCERGALAKACEYHPISEER